MTSKRILIMAGGTGGHIFPALAVADYLKSEGHGIFWLGSKVGMENRLVPQYGYPLFTIGAVGLRGSGWRRRLLTPFILMQSFFQALLHIRKIKPDVVLGMGGFASGPGGVVSWLLRKPLVIHEQNAVAGVTNRILAKFSRTVLLGFDGALTGEHVRYVGNPVRADLLNLPDVDARLSKRNGPVRILVLGGSLGARALNENLPEVFAKLSQDTPMEICHQSGQQLCDFTRKLYDKFGLCATVSPFIDNMAEAYAWADLVICRAGALTLSELCTVGIGSVLVPYPHAVDDHQTRNASALVADGAAILVPQTQLSEIDLCAVLKPLLSDRTVLLAMGRCAWQLGKRHATIDVAKICLELSHD